MTMYLSLDHDHFSAQALLAYDPTLRGHAFVVVRQNTDSHKCAVWACSSRAQKLGIHRGQAVQMGLRKHRNVEVIPCDDLIEQTTCEELGWIAEHYTPEFDVTKFGHCLLNLSGTPIEKGVDIKDIAERIRNDVIHKIGMQNVAIGAASSRLVANTLARLARPCDTRICIPGTESEILASISADLLPVSNRAKERIRRYGIKRIGQIQNLGKDALVARLGGEGERLYSLAVGTDAKKKIEKKESVEAETILDRDINDEKTLRQHVRYTADKLSHKLISATTLASRLTLTSDGHKKPHPLRHRQTNVTHSLAPHFACFTTSINAEWQSKQSGLSCGFHVRTHNKWICSSPRPKSGNAQSTM